MTTKLRIDKFLSIFLKNSTLEKYALGSLPMRHMLFEYVTKYPLRASAPLVVLGTTFLAIKAGVRNIASRVKFTHICLFLDAIERDPELVKMFENVPEYKALKKERDEGTLCLELGEVEDKFSRIMYYLFEGEDTKLDISHKKLEKLEMYREFSDMIKGDLKREQMALNASIRPQPVEWKEEAKPPKKELPKYG